MIHLTRDYILNIHFEESKEVKQLYVMETMFEHVSLRQLDESISGIIQILHANGCSITCAQVTNASTNEPLTNRMFLSLKNYPEPITKGTLKPKGGCHGKED